MFIGLRTIRTQSSSGLFSDELLSVLNQYALCILAYALSGKVVYRSISVKCVVCYVVDAACAGFKFNIAYTDLCAVQEHHVGLVCLHRYVQPSPDCLVAAFCTPDVQVVTFCSLCRNAHGVSLCAVFVCHAVLISVQSIVYFRCQSLLCLLVYNEELAVTFVDPYTEYESSFSLSLELIVES